MPHSARQAQGRTKRLVWLTDLHLNFLAPARVRGFLQGVANTGVDAVLLGGDVAESRDLISQLELIDDCLRRPVFFVLGNHDFYFGSVRRVSQEVQCFCDEHPRWTWLSRRDDVLELTARVGLVGHDGWADGRLGDYRRSLVMMNDYKLIEELAGYDKMGRWGVLKSMGDESADHLRRVLPRAVDRYKEVFVLTHVPPFREACWYDGRISDDEWLPHFTCKAAGDAILDVMRSHPERRLTVLCGHTHSPGEAWPLPNVHVLTGGATYGAPQIQRVFDLA